jgi:PAS domain-containing protein
VGGPTGNGFHQAIASSPARAPALALIDGHGEVVRLTETFRAGFAPEGSSHVSIWDFLADPDQRSRLGRVLEGDLPRAELALPSAAGSIAAEAQAVIDGAVMRHALLTVSRPEPDPEPRSGADVLLHDPSIEDSPAVVWIKDLSGHYLRINRRYTERLGIDAASIDGRSDAELSPAHVVAEPHLLGGQSGGGEPLALEYTVDAAAGRGALTVLRFPIHDLDGVAVAVCGVAAAAADATTARSEAERLLRIERWAGLSIAAIRAEVLQEWQVAEVEADEPPATPGRVLPTPSLPAPERSIPAAEPVAPPDTAELDRLHGELDAARTAAAQLEESLATATRRADELADEVSGDRGELATIEAELAAERVRAEGISTELAEARAAALGLSTDLAGARTRAEAAEREADGLRGRAEAAERDVAAERGRVQELERAGATTAAAAEQAGAEHAARIDLEQRLAVEQRRAEEAEQRLVAAEAETARDRSELVARAQRAEAAIEAMRSTGESAAAAATRANAMAELSRGRAEGLETALASAREVEAESRGALERARAEIASLQGALDAMQTENDAAREAAREANARLGATFVAPPTADLVPPPRAATPSGAPTWSHGAQRALATSLAAATEWRAGLKDALRVLGTEGGWDVAVAWGPDERGTALRCIAMWMSTPDQLSLFETSTWQRRQSPTASAIGRVAGGERSHWLLDLSSADDAQVAAAAGVGMRTALHVPIHHAGETSGVLELLSRAPVTADAEIASAMEAVALQLAHFDYLLRRGAEPRWRLGRL